MYMHSKEIARDYRTAKNKRQQIEILADLNACTKKEIELVLINEGESLPKRRKREKVDNPMEDPTDEGNIPTAVEKVLMKRIEILDDEIEALRNKLRDYEEEYLEIERFLERMNDE